VEHPPRHQGDAISRAAEGPGVEFGIPACSSIHFVSAPAARSTPWLRVATKTVHPACFCCYNNYSGNRIRSEKSAKNANERGLPFELAAELEWDKAHAFADRRRDYGEERIVAVAPMRGRLYVVCYCVRGEARRIISFRKANKQEERAYEAATANR
jgi:uncharacterized protein